MFQFITTDKPKVSRGGEKVKELKSLTQLGGVVIDDTRESELFLFLLLSGKTRAKEKDNM